MKPLTDTPDEPRLITDDAECRLLLLQLNLLDKLQAECRQVGLTNERAAHIHYVGHQTHWIMAALLAGFPKASDNGYLVVCLPKSRGDQAEFAKTCVDISRRLFPNGPDFGRIAPILPPQN